MALFRLLRRAITWSSVGLAGGALIVTTRHLLATPQPLESALAGEGRIDRRHEGDIYYNVAGPTEADVLVLLHDFYPGASNFEFRRVFARLARTHRVYAPDWLGFGMSERPALAYTGEFYAHLLREYLRGTIGRPAAVLAHGLAGNIAVRAASDEPDLFARLVLVAPRTRAGTEEAPTFGQAVIRGAQRSSMGLVPYATLTTRSALRWQLQRRAARPGEGAATDDAIEHLYASAHQFGGQFAPLAQLTGELDLPLHNALALLEPPVLIVAGERDTLQPRTQLEDLVLLNPHAQLLTIADAGDAIYEDAPDSFVERVTLWLSSARTRHAPRLAEIMHDGPNAPRPPHDHPAPAAAPAASGMSLHGGILSTHDKGIVTEDVNAPTVRADAHEVEDLSPAERDEQFVPLDAAANANQSSMPSEPRFDPTSPTPEMIGTQGDVRAAAAPPNLERQLEAPGGPAASGASTTADTGAAVDATANDSLRGSMSAPEAPVPTTIAAMTAPLDEAAPRPEEGADDPLSGPHPVPADAREDEQVAREVVTSADARITTPAAAAIVRNEQARVNREGESIKMRESARLRATMEAQVSEEAVRLEERIQAAGPAAARERAEAGTEAAPEGESPAPEPVMEQAQRPTPVATPRPTPAAAETDSSSAGQPGGERARAGAPPSGRSPNRPERNGSAPPREAPGRAGTRPASSQSANKGGNAQAPSPGHAGGQSGGAKRHGGRKTKHPHR